MFYTYIILSLKDNKYYIGHTQNLKNRLKLHNAGSVHSTKYRRPFKLVYYETFETKKEAYRREMEIKQMKGGIQFKALLTNQKKLID
jgi:putative endonuclease